MNFTALTPAQRQAFEEDGFLVVREALDQATIEAIMAIGDRLMEDFFADPEQVYCQIRQGIIQQETLAAMISHSATVPLVVQLLSPNIHLHTSSLIYKKPQDPATTPPNRGWHRDICIPDDLGHANLPRVGIKVCYCLTDFQQPSSGMTLLVRKSNARQEALAIAKGEADPPDVAEPMLNAGDAVFFENRVFHTAAPNLSEHTSKVLINGYSYRWMRPDFNLDLLDLDECPMHKMHAIDRLLLGADGYHDHDIPPRPLLEWAERHGVRPAAPRMVIEVEKKGAGLKPAP